MKEKNILIKLFLCSIYLIMITVLIVCNYHIYKDNQKEVSFSEVDNITDYSYINIYKMSEKFAYYKKSNIGIHFVIDKDENTYLIAINEKDYYKYKDIIDYSYNKIVKKPKPIKVHGYPVKVNKKLEKLINNNVDKFILKEEVTKTYYLDTTIKKKDTFNIVLYLSIITLLILIILFLITLFDKGNKTTN